VNYLSKPGRKQLNAAPIQTDAIPQTAPRNRTQYRIKEVNPHMRNLMWVVFGLMGVVAVLATAGSIESIIHTASSFQVFGTRR
jgi:hypothetical protein